MDAYMKVTSKDGERAEKSSSNIIRSPGLVPINKGFFLPFVWFKVKPSSLYPHKLNGKLVCLLLDTPCPAEVEANRNR